MSLPPVSEGEILHWLCTQNSAGDLGKKEQYHIQNLAWVYWKELRCSICSWGKLLIVWLSTYYSVLFGVVVVCCCFGLFFFFVCVCFSFSVNSTIYKQYFSKSPKLADIVKMLMALIIKSLKQRAGEQFSEFVTYLVVLPTLSEHISVRSNYKIK